MCRCWLCVGSGGREPVFACPGPLVTYFSGFSPQGVSGWGLGPAAPAGQRGREALLPGVCHGKLKKPAQCAHPLASGRPCPSGHPLCPAQRPTRAQEEQVQQPGLCAFLGRDRRCRLTLALPKPQLAVRSSVGGWEPVTEGQRGSGQGGQCNEGWAEDKDVHAHSNEAWGGHRFWQHCSLFGFCPSVVGGTLMSTTLLPGDSSCAARSAICFCDTMR